MATKVLIRCDKKPATRLSAEVAFERTVSDDGDSATDTVHGSVIVTLDANGSADASVDASVTFVDMSLLAADGSTVASARSVQVADGLQATFTAANVDAADAPAQK